MELIHLHDPVGDPAQHLVGFFRGGQLILQPIHILHKPQLLQHRAVEGVIILLLEGGVLLKTLHQQTLPVHIAVAKRADDLGHALFCAPAFHGGKQRLGDRRVLHSIKPGEAHLGSALFFIVLVLDDALDAAYGLAISLRQVKHRFRVLVVAAGLQQFLLIAVQRRHKLGAVLIQPQRKFDKFLNIFGGCYFLDRYHINPPAARRPGAGRPGHSLPARGRCGRR